MSEPKTLAEAASKPGIGMRLTISMLKKKFPSVKTMTTDELANRLGETEATCSRGKPVLLDCREEEEFKISHIPESIRVNPGDDPEKLIRDMGDLKSNDIVCYCSAGYRSSDVAGKLSRYFKEKSQDQGEVPSFYNLEGSLFKWANERRPMVDSDNQPTSFAHPYNAVFGKLLDSEHRKQTK